MLGLRYRRSGARDVPLEGKELVAANVELVAVLEGSSNDTLLGLDGEVDLVDGAEDLVDFADSSLVLKVDGGVEVRNLYVGRSADHFAFGSVHEGAHLVDLIGGTLGSETAATCTNRNCQS